MTMISFNEFAFNNHLITIDLPKYIEKIKLFNY